MPVIDNNVSRYLAAIGRRGGLATSEAKAQAARENGKQPKRNFQARKRSSRKATGKPPNSEIAQQSAK